MREIAQTLINAVGSSFCWSDDYEHINGSLWRFGEGQSLHGSKTPTWRLDNGQTLWDALFVSCPMVKRKSSKHSLQHFWDVWDLSFMTACLYIYIFHYFSYFKLLQLNSFILEKIYQFIQMRNVFFLFLFSSSFELWWWWISQIKMRDRDNDDDNDNDSSMIAVVVVVINDHEIITTKP